MNKAKQNTQNIYINKLGEITKATNEQSKEKKKCDRMQLYIHFIMLPLVAKFFCICPQTNEEFKRTTNKQTNIYIRTKIYDNLYIYIKL